MSEALSTSRVLASLKAAGESTRLRVLALLAAGEHNVTDLTRILGQSQPRISRHLKLLTDAGLVERYREGSWVFFRLAETGGVARLTRGFIDALDAGDPVLERDRDRAEAIRRERVETAQAYFRAHAAEWDRIRALHVAEDRVETAMVEILGEGPFDLVVDLGTGTARILELLSDRVDRGLGIDISGDMLAYGRAKLGQAGLKHCHVRQGDLYRLGLDDDVADVVVLHQVLHFLSDPPGALREAARILAPGGRLLIVDFAPHELEFLREEHAHQRLGFDEAQIGQWVTDAGLDLANFRELKPGDGRGELTVSLWLARKPGEGDAATSGAERQLEAAQR